MVESCCFSLSINHCTLLAVELALDAKNKTAVILKAWKNTNTLREIQHDKNNNTKTKTYSMPFIKSGGAKISSPYRWLIK